MDNTRHAFSIGHGWREPRDAGPLFKKEEKKSEHTRKKRLTRTTTCKRPAIPAKFRKIANENWTLFKSCSLYRDFLQLYFTRKIHRKIAENKQIKLYQASRN